MKQVSLVMTLGVVCITLFSSNVRSEERVYEEELILTDPTVAAQDTWKAGVAVEGWYVTGDYESQSGGTVTAEGDIDGFQLGGSAFLGHGNWALMLTSRTGNFDVTTTNNAAAAFPGTVIDTDEDRLEFEARLRYLFKNVNFLNITPYVYVGYNYTRLERDSIIRTPGITFVSTGLDTIEIERTYNSALFGAGGILPFSKRFGVRADFAGAYSDAEEDVQGTAGITDDTGLGYVWNVTGYWNITQNINLQVGGRGVALEGGNAGNFDRTGGFVMLGMSQHF